MKYKEEMRDLFSVPDEYFLAHCISADFGMGKGIVVEFNKRFDMKRKLQKTYPDYLNQWTHRKMIGDCIQQDRVFNLITKERYYQKPTYKSLTIALKEMKDLCKKLKINYINRKGNKDAKAGNYNNALKKTKSPTSRLESFTMRQYPYKALAVLGSCLLAASLAQ